MLALLFAGGMNLFAYWNSDQMVCVCTTPRRWMPRSAPEFYGMVAELAQRAGLAMPRVYVIHEEQPNAFATGRDRNMPPSQPPPASCACWIIASCVA
jgi:heat shock protein HtpX